MKNKLKDFEDYREAYFILFRPTRFLKKGKDEGKFIIETTPQPLKAGMAAEITITYIVGFSGIKVNGSLELEFPFGVEIAKRNWHYGTTCQCSNPKARIIDRLRDLRTGEFIDKDKTGSGFARPVLERNGNKAEIDCYRPVLERDGDGNLLFQKSRIRPSMGAVPRILNIKIEGNELVAGDKIIITYGNNLIQGNGCGALMCANRLMQEGGLLRLHAWLDEDGSGTFLKLREYPVLHIYPQEFHSCRIFLPSRTFAGEKINFKVNLYDIYENIASSSKATLLIDSNSTAIKGLGKLKVLKSAKGIISREIEVPSSLNTFYLRVKKQNGQDKESAISHSIVKADHNYKIFWGDLHIHSCLSNDFRDKGWYRAMPHEIYKFVQSVNHLDFASITDHYIPAIRRNTPTLSDLEWQIICETAHLLNQDGKFVTFTGAEFRCRRGDTNLHFLSDDVPPMPDDIHTIEDVWKYYEKYEFMSIPHQHSGCEDINLFSSSISSREPLIEICSNHGVFEYEGNFYPRYPRLTGTPVPHVIDLLRMGKRFGIICSSDNHNSNPGKNFLVAVYAPELTRQAIWEALKSRRCYGVTSSRMILDFRINEAMMGSEITTEKEDIKIYIRVIGPGTFEYIDIINNGTLLKRFNNDAFDFEKELIHPLGKGETEYFYLRAVQSNGEVGWTSPIWVKKL